MAASQTSALFREEDFKDVPLEGGDVPEAPLGFKPFQGLKIPRGRMLIGALCALLILEWIVLGSIVWMTQWGGMSPSQQAQSRDRMFRVTLAAEKFWRTGDSIQVEKDLADIRRDDLARTMSTLFSETTDPAARLHLTALSAVLRVDTAEPALTSSLLSQSGILFGILVSTVPLLAAVAVVALPHIRKPKKTEEERLLEQTTQRLQAEGGDGGGGEVLEELVADVEAEGEVGGPEVIGETKPEEEQAPSQEAEESDPGLGDLASLFEEEDTSISALESFCKGLPEINIDELVARGREVVERLGKANRKQ
jgi:hypothetical protein